MVYCYEPLADKVQALVDAKAFDEAIGLYEEALKADTENIDAWVDLGCVYTEKEDYEKAKEYYIKAYTLSPDLYRVNHNLAVNYYRCGDIDNALVYLHAALSIEPNAYFSLNTLGNIYRDLEKFDEALAYYQAALQFDPDGVVTITNMASLYAKQYNWRTAIRLLVSIEDILPRQYLNIYFDKQIRYHLNLERYRDAADYARRYSALDPTNDKVCAEIGYLYGQYRRYKLAVYYYEQAISLNPDEIDYWNKLLFLYDSAYNRPAKFIDYCRMAALKFNDKDRPAFELSQRLYAHCRTSMLNDAIVNDGYALINRYDPDYKLIQGYFYSEKNIKNGLPLFKNVIDNAQKAFCPQFDVFLMELSKFLEEKGEIKLSKAARKKAYRLRNTVVLDDEF